MHALPRIGALAGEAPSVSGAAARIQRDARGQERMFSVGMVMIGENVWIVSARGTFSGAMHGAFSARNLYVDAHATPGKADDMRGQLTP